LSILDFDKYAWEEKKEKNDKDDEDNIKDDK